MSDALAFPSEALLKLPIGTFAGTKRFRPMTVLGRGSKGAVYRVYDAETGTDVVSHT